MCSILSNFFSLILSKEFFSALLGGIFVLTGTWATAYYDRRKKKQEEYELTRSALQSISTELQVLLNRYTKTMGAQLNAISHDSSLDFYYSLTENYLIIFENNTERLGHLKNDCLRKSIITTYINIKSFLDGIKLNTIMLSNYESLMLSDIENINPHVQLKLRNNENARKEFAARLKQEHDILTLEIPQLIKQIKDTVESENI